MPAILEGFYLGQEGGTAVADVLFGDVSPGGKLPISFPRATGQLPVYYDRKPTSFRSYLDLTREPLFPFGHGLSYTTFKLDNLKVAPERIGPAGEATVTVDVTNTGARAGDEVVAGMRGIRVVPESKERDRLSFAFMSNGISSERQLETAVRQPEAEREPSYGAAAWVTVLADAGYAVARSLSRVHSGGLPRYALGSFIGLALILLVREAFK